jgi:mono/diheme cytochrome c family protein
MFRLYSGRFPAVLLALTTNQKLGLAGTAAVFIAFALLSSLVIPRARPDFPGRGLALFIIVTGILTIAMLGAVEVFAKEPEHGEAAQEETTTETGATETGTTETTPEPPPPPTTTEGEASGSPEAGKAVFAAQGCGNCHTFTPAGSSGTVGPDLSEALAGKDPAFIRESIVNPNAEVASGYPAGVMPQTYKDQLSPKQLDDLVSFLTSG